MRNGQIIARGIQGGFGILALYVVAAIFVIYLLLPGPLVPDLLGATKSDESGDSTEIPGVSAYFTNMSQEEVLGFYQNQFNHSSFLGLPLPTLVFSRPIQEAHEFINDQLITTYFFEYVHPLRESVYVNGWVEGKLPPVYRRWINHSINPKGQHFTSKVTIRQATSPVWARFLIAGLSVFAVIMLWRQTKKVGRIL